MIRHDREQSMPSRGGQLGSSRRSPAVRVTAFAEGPWLAERPAWPSLIVCLTFLGLFCGPACAADKPALMIRTFCIDCHSADYQEAELDLGRFVADTDWRHENWRLFGRIREAVESSHMPPQEAGQPSRAERRVLLDWLRDEFEVISEAQRGDPGLVVIPRLSKHEYRNVLRDLSGGVVTRAGEYLPGEGGAGEGFSNVGEAQGMTPAVFEKYLEAAKGSLRHLRVSAHAGLVWDTVPRDAVDDPRQAIKEATDDIIAWHVAQQQKWGELHRAKLTEKYGSAHAIYLEAAWRRRHDKPPVDEHLAPVALEKWSRILHAARPDSPFADWARAWRSLPADLGDGEIRAACLKIVTGDLSGSVEQAKEDYAPPYEISFHEAKDEVLEAAANEGRWPFRIDIGDATELFLVVTDAGDGGQGEYAVWRKGRFVFKDGTAKPWQEAVQVVGANSGKPYDWGVDGEGSRVLGRDSIGVRPPGSLKFPVPEGAIVFEVDLTLDHNRTKLASIQALVLKEKPRSQSYIPGRFVFGGRKRQVDARQEENRQRDRLLRLRNVAEANRTKIGLNAERNVLAAWTGTDLAAIGGPWDDQDQEQEVADAPYHYTVAQVRRNATLEDLAELRELEARLLAIAAPPPADELEARATRWLDQFAARAWRRPLRDVEREMLVTLYREAASQGVSFDSAMKTPLMAVLASPVFLYRGNESGVSDGSQTPASSTPVTRPLTSLELASRLSFFLWASIPDEELLGLAAENRLRDPAVLREQARRMLRDPRARSLAVDFAAQLWGFADFDQFTGPDSERFPEFTPALRQAMYDEVVTFLDDLFRHDRPLTAILEADYTFANGELARHYGIENEPGMGATEGVGGERWRGAMRIPLTRQRGGLATMGLFLTKTSLPLRTSPVQRGVWIAEQLLGREIPSPPADVPSISEDETSPDGLSVREQLERHRSSASCAACHARFDPLGVALENFDPVGRWRTTLREGGELSNSDRLPGGREISGVAGLNRYLVDHRDEVFSHFNRKLLGYALGRAVQPGDSALLERLSDGLQKHEHQLSFLVETIVLSPQFISRRP